MNLPCKELKRIARDNLNGNYKIPMGAFLAATLIPLAVELPFSMLQKDAQPLPVTIMFYVAEFLITLLSMVLSVGILQLHLSLARKKEMTLGMVFYGFKITRPLYHCRTAFFDYCNADQLYSCDHRCCVIFVLDKSPAAIAVLVIRQEKYCEHDSGSFRADVVCTGIVSAFGSSADEGTRIIQKQAADHLKISRQIMKGNKGRLFYIYLSFIGLQILCLLSLGIRSLWVYPYQSQTLVIFYLDVVGEIPSNIS